MKVTAARGTEYTKFLAALAILHQDYLKKRMNRIPVMDSWRNGCLEKMNKNPVPSQNGYSIKNFTSNRPGMVSAAFKYCTSPTSVFILILSLYDTQAAILLPPLLLFLLLVVAAARHLRLHGGLCGDNAEKEHISHRLPQVSTVQVAYWE